MAKSKLPPGMSDKFGSSVDNTNSNPRPLTVVMSIESLKKIFDNKANGKEAGKYLFQVPIPVATGDKYPGTDKHVSNFMRKTIDFKTCVSTSEEIAKLLFPKDAATVMNMDNKEMRDLSDGKYKRLATPWGTPCHLEYNTDLNGDVKDGKVRLIIDMDYLNKVDYPAVLKKVEAQDKANGTNRAKYMTEDRCASFNQPKYLMRENHMDSKEIPIFNETRFMKGLAAANANKFMMLGGDRPNKPINMSVEDATKAGKAMYDSFKGFLEKAEKGAFTITKESKRTYTEKDGTKTEKVVKTKMPVPSLKDLNLSIVEGPDGVSLKVKGDKPTTVKVGGKDVKYQQALDDFSRAFAVQLAKDRDANPDMKGSTAAGLYSNVTINMFPETKEGGTVYIQPAMKMLTGLQPYVNTARDLAWCGQNRQNDASRYYDVSGLTKGIEPRPVEGVPNVTARMVKQIDGLCDKLSAYMEATDPYNIRKGDGDRGNDGKGGPGDGDKKSGKGFDKAAELASMIVVEPEIPNDDELEF